MGDILSLSHKRGAQRIAEQAVATAHISHIEQAIEDGKVVTFIHNHSLAHMTSMEEVQRFLRFVDLPVSYVVSDSTDAFGWLVYTD